MTTASPTPTVLAAKSTPEQERLEKMAALLRDYIMDFEEINHLNEGEEFTQNQLILYVIMAHDAFNTQITPITNFTILDFPSLSCWLDGAAYYAMKAAVFKYIRNAFQYNDSGVQVAVEEKAAEYERTLQRLEQRFFDAGQRIKEHINLEGCYGGFNSEYLNLYIYRAGRTILKKGV